MSAAGYQAMCLGNHEFDFGQDNLDRQRRARPTFPFLGANVAQGRRPAARRALTNAAGRDRSTAVTTVLECAGRRIGVFGIATHGDRLTSVNPALPCPTSSFADEIAAAEEQIAALSAQGVDAIVALCHLGDGPVPCKAVDLAAGLSADAAAKLAAIVDGHSHTVENEEVNGVLVVQTGCNGANLGKLTLAFDEDGTVSASEELLDAAACAAIASASTDVAADLEAVTADLNVLMGEVLFSNPTTLWAGWLCGDRDRRPHAHGRDQLRRRRDRRAAPGCPDLAAGDRGRREHTRGGARERRRHPLRPAARRGEPGPSGHGVPVLQHLSCSRR